MLQTAKEYITRPLEHAEIDVIDRACQVMEHDYQLQLRLEALHGLPSSQRDKRALSLNRLRLVTLAPEAGMQVRLMLLTCKLDC